MDSLPMIEGQAEVGMYYRSPSGNVWEVVDLKDGKATVLRAGFIAHGFVEDTSRSRYVFADTANLFVNPASSLHELLSR